MSETIYQVQVRRDSVPVWFAQGVPFTPEHVEHHVAMAREWAVDNGGGDEIFVTVDPAEFVQVTCYPDTEVTGIESRYAPEDK